MQSLKFVALHVLGISQKLQRGHLYVLPQRRVKAYMQNTSAGPFAGARVKGRDNVHVFQSPSIFLLLLAQADKAGYISYGFRT